MKPGPPSESSQQAPAEAAKERAEWKEYFRPADLTKVLFVIIIAVYWVSVSNGFIYDDHELIFSYPAPQSAGEVAAIFGEPHYRDLPYYRPITRMTLLLQKSVPALSSAFMFHLFNVVLVAALGLAAWNFFRESPFEFKIPLAAGGALLLALHPVTSSAVHAITGREALLAALFMIPAVRLYCKRAPAARVGAFLLFALALLCREVAVVTILLFVAADILRISLRPPESNIKSWAIRYAAPVSILIVYFIIRGIVLGDVEGGIKLQEEFLLIPLSWLYALQSILLPTFDLVYEPLPSAWFHSLKLLAVIVLIVTLVLAIARTRSRRTKVVAFGAIWFVVTFLPTSNLLMQESPFAERHLILPLFGFLIIILEVLNHLDQKVMNAIYSVGALILIGAAFTSYHRAQFFESDATFYYQRMLTNSESADALHDYAYSLISSSNPDFETAEEYLEKSIAIEPTHVRALNNLGYLMMVREEYEDARDIFERALKINPRNAHTWNNIGTVYSKEGMRDQAIEAFAQGLEVDPWDRDLNYNYGTLLMDQGQNAEALEHFLNVLRVSPIDSYAHTRIAQLFALDGDQDNAIEYFERSIALGDRRADTYNNFGVSLAQNGELIRAAKMFQRATELNPNLQSAQENLERTRRMIERGQ